MKFHEFSLHSRGSRLFDSHLFFQVRLSDFKSDTHETYLDIVKNTCTDSSSRVKSSKFAISTLISGSGENPSQSSHAGLSHRKLRDTTLKSLAETLAFGWELKQMKVDGDDARISPGGYSTAFKNCEQ